MAVKLESATAARRRARQGIADDAAPAASAGTAAADGFDEMNVKDLRSAAKEAGLKVSGSKAELVARLRAGE